MSVGGRDGNNGTDPSLLLPGQSFRERSKHVKTLNVKLKNYKRSWLVCRRRTGSSEKVRKN